MLAGLLIVATAVLCNKAYLEDKCNGILDEHRCTSKKDCCFFKLKQRDLKYEYCISKSLTVPHVRDFYNTYNDLFAAQIDSSDLFVRDLYSCCALTQDDKVNMLQTLPKDILSRAETCMTNSSAKETSLSEMKRRVDCMVLLMQKRGEPIELIDLKCLSGLWSVAVLASLAILF